MERMVKVNFRGETKEFLAGTKFKDIALEFKDYFNYKILIANVDNELTSLEAVLTKKCNVNFLDRSSSLGNGIYARSLEFILILAVRRLFGKDAEVIIEHSIDKGVYCEIQNASINKTIIRSLEKEMLKIVDEDLIFTKVNVLRKDAIKYFKNEKRFDKVRVLKYISNTFINLYRIDDMYDYFYGDLATSTGAIDSFKLTYIADNGFVLSSPTVHNPECTYEYVHHKQLFNTFLAYARWGTSIDIRNAADLNEMVSMGNYAKAIQLSEAYYNTQLAKIAEEIYENKDNTKIVLIAGPSSSGKTTTAKKLQTYLGAKGIKTHPIGIDDYYVNREDTPKDSNGDYDYECIEAIDLKLFNKNLTKLLNGEKVELPTYNFVTGKREYHEKYLTLKKDEIIIIEGLHALNDKLTSSIDKEFK